MRRSTLFMVMMFCFPLRSKTLRQPSTLAVYNKEKFGQSTRKRRTFLLYVRVKLRAATLAHLRGLLESLKRPPRASREAAGESFKAESTAAVGNDITPEPFQKLCIGILKFFLPNDAKSRARKMNFLFSANSSWASEYAGWHERRVSHLRGFKWRISKGNWWWDLLEDYWRPEANAFFQREIKWQRKMGCCKLY